MEATLWVTPLLPRHFRSHKIALWNGIIRRGRRLIEALFDETIFISHKRYDSFFGRIHTTRCRSQARYFYSLFLHSYITFIKGWMKYLCSDWLHERKVKKFFFLLPTIPLRKFFFLRFTFMGYLLKTILRVHIRVLLGWGVDSFNVNMIYIYHFKFYDLKCALQKICILCETFLSKNFQLT